ncbi:hypothetical protein EF847_03660 [Actinobacteria bacterium YIM 96077]|uniref:LppX_LprAFG lipoprotein n=1 Tax=Phytoactinopolyspora halophila TaxID=1981511 RepID=A0A329R6Y8_9ACTN|nr:hypothetical protein EF847_03660 [Actinobacteria bacterium YIM 96077]RAW18828.1 hypothetical protein DPM12_01850 [Phytoactinopolyspora halophila]
MTACGDTDDESAATPLAEISSGEETAPAENGIDELPADEVLDLVIQSLDEAETYRVQGTTLAGSTIDISFKVGEGSVGTVTTDSEVELVASDDVVYITSDPSTLADVVDEDIEETIADKWLLLSPESSSNFRIFVEGSEFADAVLGSEVEDEMTSVQEVDGVPAVGLIFAENGGTLWVAAEGEPRPIRFEERGASGGSGVLTFSDFGEEVELSVPDEDDVVDPSELPSSAEEENEGEESDG